MVYHLDNFDPEQKRVYVITACSIGICLSTISLALRFRARHMQAQRLYREDWVMFFGWICSLGIAASTFMGLIYSMGEHEVTIRAKPNGKALMKKCLMSIWIIQRLYPPAHLFIKTSIILFYCRIFQTSKFKKAAWVVWGYTFLWSIHAQLASLLECLPPTYFYDREIPGGHCVPNPLINISLTESILNTLGDLAIFIMPMPLLKQLHISDRKRTALYGIFAVGLLVNITSFVRWVSLLGTAEDITSSLNTSSTWTYLEVAMAVTCGNLPLLGPIFGGVFRRRGSQYTPPYPDHADRSATKWGTPGSSAPRSKGHSVVYPEEITLQDRSNEALNETYAMQRTPEAAESKQILVEEEVIVSYAQNAREARSGDEASSRGKNLSVFPPATSHASKAWANV